MTARQRQRISIAAPEPPEKSLIDFLAEATAELSWQEDALCAEVDAEMFFPEKGSSTNDAKLICRLCEVQDECLEYALDRNERYGVWGGLSERERRALLKTNNPENTELEVAA